MARAVRRAQHRLPNDLVPAGRGHGCHCARMTREIADLLLLRAQVRTIRQDESGVSVTWRDTAIGVTKQSRAHWCLCTIPLSVLSQIEMNVSAAMEAAIN